MSGYIRIKRGNLYKLRGKINKKKGDIMSRILKENINTSFFHIMVQGINKEYIFDSEEDIKKYMKIMEQTKQKINTTILAYCMMGNHAHILFYEKDVNILIKYMHRTNLLYAKYYNKKYNRVGYVFRDRYKTQPIYSEKHLYLCVKYIHNNPVKANICQKASQYKYSSYNNNIFYTDTELEKNIKKYMYIEEPEKTTQNNEKSFIMMEEEQDKEQICNDLMKEIMRKNNMTKEDVIKNEELINIIIKKLKYENDISYRMIERALGINRKRLSRIEKRQKNSSN